MRCPSFSVSTSTPSQSNRSAAGRGEPEEDEEDDAEEKTTPPRRLSQKREEDGAAFLPNPTRIWRAEVAPSADETGRRR
ncbi:unnamed protein product [Spirodela intermedia]|uniref:Uncharacterized protein n=2 Tax=Spirodela intermedia TaxID=51605 RepID=A0A7I8JFD4_SPIIN|nr:unnamed protein product [Spirodela intermedia]CAA6668253.1 unnamed protein product [Spirodela intermedia]CAA7405087.1 unnamed protein product [Spirodela intermedia]